MGDSRQGSTDNIQVASSRLAGDDSELHDEFLKHMKGSKADSDNDTGRHNEKLERKESQSEDSQNPYSSANSVSSSSSLDDFDDDEPIDKAAHLRRYMAISIIKQLSLVFVVVYLQHLGSFFLIFVVQAYFYKELTKYGIKEEKEAQLGWILKGGFRLLYWYWFILASLWLHWEILDPHLDESLKSKWHLPATAKARADYEFYIFFAYVLGLVFFVLTLRQRHYKYQFERFAYCHVLLFVFALSCFTMVNIFKGLIYFFLPLELVSVNSSVLKCIYIIATGRDDTFSYKHSSFSFRLDSLPNLSFFVAWIVTMLAAFVLSRVLTGFDLFICPKQDLLPNYWPSCSTPPVFEMRPLKDVIGSDYARRFPDWLNEVEISDFDEHAFWIAIFTSFVSPFGGFFTAAFKRAFKLRIDLGQGPFADRLDCHLLTGVFVFTYINARLLGNTNQDISASVLELFHDLKAGDRLKIYQDLGKSLSKSGF